MPPASLLTRGSQAGVAIASGANNDVDVMCQGDSTLVVQTDMTAAVAGDLTVTVQPYEADNATISGAVLQPDAAMGPTLLAGHAYHTARFNVNGLERVRVRITNNNAGPQTITRASWRLQ